MPANGRTVVIVEQYADRAEAGRILGKLLAETTEPGESLRDAAARGEVIVLGLPRGGIVVAAEVAKALDAPLDAFVVRKLGLPGRSELAMGAVASGGVRVLNEDVLGWHTVSEEAFARVAAAEEAELARREAEYRGDRPPPDLGGKFVVLVDDGLATGASMRAAVAAVRASEPARILVAVPVAPPDAIALLESEGAEVLCPLTPRSFGGVGRFFRDFDQTEDAEVRELLSSL